MAETLAVGLPLASSPSNYTSTEGSLVVQAQAGETLAFDSLMRMYRERVFGVVRNFVGNPTDAAEVTQDVFIKAFTNIKKYNFASSFFTWIYRIAVNESLNFQRKARSKKANLFERILPSFTSSGRQRTDEERLSELSGEFSGRPAEALGDELQLQLDKAISTLSEDHRAALVLTEIEGLGLQEASEILGVSVGTVKSRLHYAKKRLQTLLKPYLTV